MGMRMFRVYESQDRS